MRETATDLKGLQKLLDDSVERAGSYGRTGTANAKTPL
jgi:hypothetical protein